MEQEKKENKENKEEENKEMEEEEKGEKEEKWRREEIQGETLVRLLLTSYLRLCNTLLKQMQTFTILYIIRNMSLLLLIFLYGAKMSRDEHYCAMRNSIDRFSGRLMDHFLRESSF